MNCIKCGEDSPAYRFRVLQVQTLHVRDLGGEKRVQALGGFEEYAVCASCAEEKLESLLDDRKALLKSVLPFVLLGLCGFAVTAFFLKSNGAFRLLGLGMLVCGLLGTWSNAQSTGKRKRQLTAMPREKALYDCAWECLLEKAPKKNDINDITYIPIDETTLARKNGDLMILYDLLPEIAVQAYKRIHGEEDEA